MRFLLLMWLLRLLYPQEPALKANDADFVFIDEIYSFSAKANDIFFKNTWQSQSPGIYEFVFLHLKTPVYISSVKADSAPESLLLFTNLGQKVKNNSHIYNISSSPGIILFVNLAATRANDVLIDGRHYVLSLDSSRLKTGKVSFYDAAGHKYPVFVLRRPEYGAMTRTVSLNDSLALGFNQKYFFLVRRLKNGGVGILLSLRRKGYVKGTYFEFYDGKYRRTTAGFRVAIDRYFVKTPFVSLPYRIPDSAFVCPAQFDTTIITDIRYATDRNFTHRKLYPCAKCWLRYDVARDLVAAARDFYQLGYRLVLLDCYRPPSVQRKMWSIMPDKNFVAPPGKGSMHNRGVAVDVTLAHLNGKYVDMGTPYDYFGKAAYPSYRNLSKKVLYHRQLLGQVMKLHNFHPIRTEWWHFYHLGFNRYGPVEFDMCQSVSR